MSNVFSRFENGVESAVDAAAGKVFKAPIEPAQLAKKAEKQMRQSRLIGKGHQYAPTLYNVLVNESDDKRLFGFYPTMAAEIETYLMARGAASGLDFDGRPLVRFIVDDHLKKGKFDVIAEHVAAAIIRKLREEEMEYYGLTPRAVLPEVFAEADEYYPAQDEREPDLAGRPDSVGRPDLAERPDMAGQPDAAGRPDVRERSGMHFASFDDEIDVDEPLPSKGNAVLIDLKDNTRYPLDFCQITIGRDSSNDIVLVDANASRVHAQLTQDITGIWKIFDLDSTNGTMLNDHTIRQAFLRPDDRITIGLTTLEFKE